MEHLGFVATQNNSVFLLYQALNCIRAIARALIGLALPLRKPDFNFRPSVLELPNIKY
jgi:hypothetical protein